MITDEVKRVDAQAYAESVRAIVQRKHNLEESIANQRSELGLSGVALGEKITTSPSMDAIPEGIAALVDMVDRYSVDLNQYVNAIDEFERAIRRLWPQYEHVLELRYVQCKQWDVIAKTVAYNEKYIYEVHRSALIGLYDVMPAAWKRA